MEERLTKIAETSFRKAMAEFSYWGDIGIALKNIQSEIREVSKRTRTVEHILGHPWNYGQNAKTSADKTSSEIRHLSGEQIKKIRLRKKLKISHMAQLLNVSIRKYTETARLTENRPELDEQEQRAINERLAYIADHINEQPQMCIRYFIPDERENGGAIVEVSGKVKKYLPLTEQSL